jgi:hypothetical protein
MRLKREQKVLPKRVNINLEASLHDRFKATVAAQGQNMTEVLIEFIVGYLRTAGKVARAK